MLGTTNIDSEQQIKILELAGSEFYLVIGPVD